MEYVFGILGLGILVLIWFVAGLAGSSSRREAAEEELDEWSGVYDVKREIDNHLADDDNRERLRNKYNKK